MAGISNFQIEETFNKIGDEDLLKNFVGDFPSKKMNKFMDHPEMIYESGKFPFVIANTDAADDKPTAHWWSILDIEPKYDIFFFRYVWYRGTKTFHNSR